MLGPAKGSVATDGVIRLLAKARHYDDLEISFDYAIGRAIERVRRQIREIEKLRQAGERPTGIRWLTQVQKWLHSLTRDEGAVHSPPPALVPWFGGNWYSSVLCPTCGIHHPKLQIRVKRWATPGIRRPGSGRMGACGGTYLQCPRGHQFLRVRTRVS